MLTGLGLIAAGLGILFCARAAHQVAGDANRWSTREQWRNFPRLRRWMLSVTTAGTTLGIAVGVAAIVVGILLAIGA
jgi:hypothetical protein